MGLAVPKKVTRPGGQPGGSGSARGGWGARAGRKSTRSVFERSGLPVRV